MSCNKCKKVGLQINPDILIGINDILIVGESPKGQLLDCLKSPTFKRLSDNLKIIKVKLSDCSFTEICKCELSNRNDLIVVGQNCISRLVDQITKLKPKIVITLGVTANQIFAKQYNIAPKVGRLIQLKDFAYLPLWHTSPINPRGYRKNQDLLKNIRFT